MSIAATLPIPLQALKNKSRRGKKAVTMMKENESDGPMNEELKALEAHMLSISKQGQDQYVFFVSVCVIETSSISVEF